MISVIIPAYNEEQALPATLPPATKMRETTTTVQSRIARTIAASLK